MLSLSKLYFSLNVRVRRVFFEQVNEAPLFARENQRWLFVFLQRKLVAVFYIIMTHETAYDKPPVNRLRNHTSSGAN